MNTLFKRVLAIFLIIGTIAVFDYLSDGYDLPHYTDAKLHTESSWTVMQDGQLLDDDATLPMYWPADSTQKFTLSTTLTYEPTNPDLPCAFISLNHMYVRVFLDDIEIYTFTSSTTPNRTHSPGNAYAIVPLGSNCTGKELRIEILPTLQSGLVYALNDITFGDFTTVMRDTYLSDIPHLIMSVTLLFCGCVLVAISLSIRASKKNKQTWYIGIFAILFSIYSFTEILFTICMVSNPYFMYLANFILLAILPIPLLCFYQERTEHQMKRSYHLLIFMATVNVITQAVLHFSGQYDLRQMLPATHLVYTCALILIPVSVFSVKNRQQRNYLMIETCCLTAGGVLDALFFHLNMHPFFSYTECLQLGMLVVLLMEGVDLLRSTKETYIENLKSQFYKELAYTDALTKLQNRMAFNAKTEAISSGVYQFKQMICMSVDVNGLKPINDTFGHLAGDGLIQTVADFLQMYFSKCSDIYRIGGDEFFLYIYDTDEAHLDAMLDDLYADIAVYNVSADIPISFAIGYCNYDGTDLEQTIQTADARMYKHKAEMRSDDYTPRSTAVYADFSAQS